MDGTKAAEELFKFMEKIIGHATGQAAHDLMINYLMYVRIEAIFTIIMGYAAAYVFYRYGLWCRKSVDSMVYNDFNIFLLEGLALIPYGVCALITLINTGMLPKMITIIIDPRMSIVFSVLGKLN